MLRPLFGPVLAAALLAAGSCLADPPAPAPQPTPAPTAQGLELPDKPPVCVPVPAVTS